MKEKKEKNQMSNIENVIKHEMSQYYIFEDMQCDQIIFLMKF